MNHRENGEAPAKQCPECRSADRRRLRGLPRLRVRVPAARAAEPRGDGLDRGHPLRRGDDRAHPRRGASTTASTTSAGRPRTPRRRSGSSTGSASTSYQSRVDLLRAHRAGPRQKAESWWRRAFERAGARLGRGGGRAGRGRRPLRDAVHHGAQRGRGGVPPDHRLRPGGEAGLAGAGDGRRGRSRARRGRGDGGTYAERRTTTSCRSDGAG